jgi:cyanophycinase
MSATVPRGRRAGERLWRYNRVVRNRRRNTLISALPAAALGLAVWLAAQGTVGPAKGALVIVGGGPIGPAIIQRFVDLAGGPEARFVLIPTAQEDPIDIEQAGARFSKQFGVKRVTVRHTRDRQEADSAAFVAPLCEASAVWLGGGRQWRLVDSYLHTRTQKEIEALLERGGVVGGTSAGATIQGSYLVRGAPEGNTIMMAKGHEEGLALLKNTTIDQHGNTRHREKDLVPVIEAHPGLLGIGLDESTAIIVQGDAFDVVGEGKVRIYDGREHSGDKFYALSPGDRFDLKARRVIEPGK